MIMMEVVIVVVLSALVAELLFNDKKCIKESYFNTKYSL